MVVVCAACPVLTTDVLAAMTFYLLLGGSLPTYLLYLPTYTTSWLEQSRCGRSHGGQQDGIRMGWGGMGAASHGWIATVYDHPARHLKPAYPTPAPLCPLSAARCPPPAACWAVSLRRAALAPLAALARLASGSRRMHSGGMGWNGRERNGVGWTRMERTVK